jgi:cysteine-rich repeat protein
MPDHAPRVRGSSVALVVGALLVAAASADAAVDLAGKWQRSDGTIVTITQVGDTITIPRDGYSVSGTVTAPGDFTMSGTPAPGCTESGTFHLFAGEEVLQGELTHFCVPIGSPPVATVLTLTRCTCDDGNTADGDGCDATCRVEPCFTCAGDPSVCTPSADGAACDDRRTCTTGETCSAGVCGGGAVVPACVDLSGSWRYRETFFGFTAEDRIVIEERGPIVVFRGQNGIVGAGPADVSTGEIVLRRPWGFSPLCTNTVTTADLTATSVDFAGTSVVLLQSAMTCLPMPSEITGDRCGFGTLEGAETCDDGNDVAGDGCSADCQQEVGWSCVGEPSVCTLVPPGTPCDDGNPCTSNDVIGLSGSCQGTPVEDGTACDDGNACTTADACQAGFCTGGPAVTCEACFACDPAAGCQPSPRPLCRKSQKPEKSVLQIIDSATPGKDRIKWKLAAGAATTTADLGSPTTSSDVTFCVFDESSGTPALAFRAAAPAASTCGTKPCWKATSTSIRWASKTGAPDGLTKVVVKTGPAGKAKAQIDAKGALLTSPAPPLPTPLRVQLQVEGGACFETRHQSPTINQPGRFQSRGSN